MTHGQVRQKWEAPTVYEDKAEKRRAAELNWRTVCRLVDIRDGYACRVCGDRNGVHEHHHVIRKSRGGADSTSNVIRACRSCHSLDHASKLAIEGDADTALTISRRDADGRWFVAKQETSVRVYVTRD